MIHKNLENKNSLTQTDQIVGQSVKGALRWK